jgi:hypothetical protein
MSKFKDILARRGQVIIFTGPAKVGLSFEQSAERQHANVVCTRGWADIYGPLHSWTRIVQNNEYGVLSCDQFTYLRGVQLKATDYVWVGNCFENPEQHARYLRAANMANDHRDPYAQRPVLFWTIGEEDL